MRAIVISLAVSLAACASSPISNFDGGMDGGPDDGGPGDAGLTCALHLDGGSPFGDAAVISDPGKDAFTPSVAARDGGALVFWHEFDGQHTEILFARIMGDCVTAPEPIAESLPDAKHPVAVATASGYALAYDAQQDATTVIRLLRLAPDGTAEGSPETVSAPDAGASSVRISASGDEVALAWTTGSAHQFALRGPSENLDATAVGTQLQNATLLNFPRVALAPDGTLFLVYRDAPDSQYEVYATSRPPGGSFGAPADISNSPGLTSDDVSLALEDDGTLDAAWVEQDPQNVNDFEVVHAARSPQGSWSRPAFYGRQGLQAWTPSVLPGFAAAWNSGASGIGSIFYSATTAPAEQLFPGLVGNAVSLARSPDGTLYLAFQEGSTPRAIRLARGR